MRILTGCLLLSISFSALAQSKETKYPKTLWSPNDRFTVRFSNFPDEPETLMIGEEDTVDMGTDGSPGLYVTVIYGKDSTVFEYKNMPFAQIHYIPFRSPRGKSIYRLHFNGVSASYSSDYVRANEGKVAVEIPEVYELANILWAFSPAGNELGLDTNDAYYKSVAEWIKPHKDHPVFKKLATTEKTYYDDYFSFRENSYAFHFPENAVATDLLCEGPYYYIWGNDWDNYSSLFKELKPAIEDFAKRSGYRRFYEKNKPYYEQQIKRQRELLPVDKMWTWLENEFPAKFHSYKIVFSPFITGSHSTQQFGDFVDNQVFREAVMFICGPQGYDGRPITDKQKEGLMSGIVFTEIDHNYVNPVSYKFEKEIDEIFAPRAFWANEVQFYNEPVSVFNEYMTHALFCLYVAENYDKETADYVVGKRNDLMVDWRKFSKFREFNAALAAIRTRNKDKKVVELYPEILDWCRKFAG
jgi:hypothetical protein